MLKFFLIIAVILSSLELSLDSSYADDNVVGDPVVSNEFQGNSQGKSVLSNDLPSLKIKGMIQSFVIVLVLIGVFFVFLKWRYSGFSGFKGNKKYIKVIEQAALGPKKYIYLVKVLDKIIVVGASNEGMYLLSEMVASEKEELLEQAEEVGGSFANFIKNARNKSDKD